ncbi:hypothetical protein ACFOG5_04985 [Pedobacter fastidiosus]|uniref:Uncharacterized protein n=1 Tax=Pedobacter fastidiosus TaxID=2765361 RepID=A0ABR7KS12_9SPHI|nr:hypothetical protein [Pedobacter fastidiosus]MBC6110498.1 hypothetical protein [Pedobacter fastidiosus]
MENINPSEKENQESLQNAYEGNVDGTNFGGSQNEDQSEDDKSLKDTLEGGDYSKEGGKLEGQDFDTHESTGDPALENDVSANDI